MTMNQASRRAMEKIGLTCARRFHPGGIDTKAGSAAGEVAYQATRAQWASKPQAV